MRPARATTTSTDQIAYTVPCYHNNDSFKNMLLVKNIITRDVTSLFAIKIIMHPFFPRFVTFKNEKKT